MNQWVMCVCVYIPHTISNIQHTLCLSSLNSCFSFVCSFGSFFYSLISINQTYKYKKRVPDANLSIHHKNTHICTRIIVVICIMELDGFSPFFPWLLFVTVMINGEKKIHITYFHWPNFSKISNSHLV